MLKSAFTLPLTTLSKPPKQTNKNTRTSFDGKNNNTATPTGYRFALSINSSKSY